MIVRELLTVLGFKIDDSNASKYEDVLGKLKTGALAAVAAIGAAGAAIAALVVKTANEGDEIAKAAKRIGISAEDLQTLEFAAERSGASVGELRAGIKFLQRNAVEASKGVKTAKDAFDALKVSVKDSSGQVRPASQLFDETAAALGAVTNESKRTALAMDIFGRGGAALIPLFAEGSKGLADLRDRARELGFIFSEEDAAAAEVLNDSLTDLDRAVKGIRRRFATQLIPTATKIVDAMTDWLIANRELIDRGLKQLVEWTERTIRAVADFSGWVNRHKDFLITLAAVITATLLPALAKLALAWGVVAGRALIAAAISAAPFLAVLALAGLIALVINDVFHFVRGDAKTLLGELFDTFTKEAMKPDSHWMVRTIAAIVSGLRDAIIWVNKLFSGFFEDADRLGGIEEALKQAFKNAMDYWTDQLDRFLRDAAARIRAAFLFPGSRPSETGAGFGGYLRSQEFWGPLHPDFWKSGQGVPSVGQNVNVTVGGARVVIQTPTGATAGANSPLSNAALDELRGILEDERRETAREVESRVVR